MNRPYLALCLTLCVVGAPACGEHAASSAMDSRLTSLKRTDELSSDLPDVERGKIVSAGYEKLFADIRATSSLAKVDNSLDIDAAFQGARYAAFYSTDERYVREMKAYLEALEARGLASQVHYERLFKELVRARMLGDAAALAARHPAPDLEALPVVRQEEGLAPGAPTELVVDPDQRVLMRRSVDLHLPAQVVIISHPGCHFSQNAMKAILADPVLTRAIRGHTRWLAPPRGSFDFDIVQKWNREHPGMETTLTYRREEWPMLDHWATPSFYFFKNGALITKFEGWHKGEGHRVELTAALREIGLL